MSIFSGWFSRRRILKGSAGSLFLLGLGACDFFEDSDKKKTVLAGRRITVLSTGAGLSVSRDNRQKVTLPAPVPVKSWPQIGRVPDHVAVNGMAKGAQLLRHYPIGTPVAPFDLLAWITIFPNNRGAMQSPPVVADGRIFTTDAQGVVRGWTWPGMKLLWKRQPAKGAASTNIGGGLALKDGVLYIVDGVSHAMAVDPATGKIRWKVKIGMPGRSAPLVADGLVAFATIDSRLWVLDAKSGRQLWTYQATAASTVIFGAGTPALKDGVLLAGFNSGDLVALRAKSGELIWSDTLGGGNGRGSALDFACVRGSPVIVDQTAYAISMSQVLVALDMRSGRRLWEREVSGQNPLCVCGDWLYLISLDQQVACLNRHTGEVRWVSQLRRFENEARQKGAVEWVGPLLAGGRLVCFSSFPKEGMVVLNAFTGKMEYSEKTHSPCTVEPVLCDGEILTVSHDAVLRVYG